MTNDYVTLPREPTREMLAAFFAAIKPSGVHTPGWLERGYAAMIAAAPPAASGRVRGLVWECLHETYWRAKPLAGLPAPYFAAQTSEGAKIAALAPNEHLGMFDDVDAAKAACEAHWQAYVRTLLAPAVDERAASSEPEMCPNCVTPWKCNGPHEFPQAASSEAAVAFDAERFERAPCYLCGYNGRGYYQPETHPCAAKYHAHPAPTTADAGVTEANLVRFWRNRYISELTLRIRNRGVNLEVAIAEAEHVANEAERALKAAPPHPASGVAVVTEAMVETFEAKFLECARTRPDSTLRDDIRAALVAALGARKGE